MNSSLKITSFVFTFVILFFSYAYAENEVSEGYDENTEVTLKGTIKDVGRGMRGPVIVLLQVGGKNYQVITAPPWYIAQEGIELKLGSSYEVTGSKFISRDGKPLYNREPSKRLIYREGNATQGFILHAPLERKTYEERHELEALWLQHSAYYDDFEH